MFSLFETKFREKLDYQGRTSRIEFYPEYTPKGKQRLLNDGK